MHLPTVANELSRDSNLGCLIPEAPDLPTAWVLPRGPVRFSFTPGVPEGLGEVCSVRVTVWWSCPICLTTVFQLYEYRSCRTHSDIDTLGSAPLGVRFQMSSGSGAVSP